MTKQDFIDLLKSRGYAHMVSNGDVTLTHNGYVYLTSLTSLPEGVKFENHGSVYLTSLTSKHTYRGKEYEFAWVDGYTMLVGATKAYGGYEVSAAHYFGGGEVNKLRKCYVAKSGDLYAHGDSMKTAIEDLQFKLTENANKEELAAEVMKTGKVTLAQFRGLTGACREGIRAHLAERGIDLENIESMDLKEAVAAMSGTSFGDAFLSYVNASEAA